MYLSICIRICMLCKCNFLFTCSRTYTDTHTQNVCARMYIHTCTYINVHTHIHTYAHTYTIHAYNTYTHAHTQSHTYIHTCTYIHIYTHTNLNMYLQAAVQGIYVLKDVIDNTRNDALHLRVVKHTLATHSNCLQ